MDPNQILSEIKALLENERTVALNALEQQKENQNSAINNAAFARGLGRSGVPTIQQVKFAGEKYLPAYNKINTAYSNQISIVNNSVQESLKKIDALNQASAKLGG